MGPSWGLLGRSWSRLGALEPSWGSLGVVLGPSWGPLGLSWALLGSSWGLLGPSWGLLGPSWGLLGRSWSRLGAVLGPLGALLEPSWGHLRGPKTQSSEVAKMSQNAIRIAFLGPRGVQERAKLGSNCDRKTSWSHHVPKISKMSSKVRLKTSTMQPERGLQGEPATRGRAPGRARPRVKGGGAAKHTNLYVF